jgi:hypothetical protein
MFKLTIFIAVGIVFAKVMTSCNDILKTVLTFSTCFSGRMWRERGGDTSHINN